MVSNDNDDRAGGDKVGVDTGAFSRGQFRDYSASRVEETWMNDGKTSAAFDILSLDAAHSLSLAMFNAVTEQQSNWVLQRVIMTKAMDQLLRNNAADRALDLLLKLFEPARESRT